MVSLQDSRAGVGDLASRRTLYTPPSIASSKAPRPAGRSMRTVRSTIFETDRSSCAFTGSTVGNSSCLSENLSDSVVDMRLSELALRETQAKTSSSSSDADFLDFSQAFSDSSAGSSQISGELERLANLPSPEGEVSWPEPEPLEPCTGFLERESFSAEIIDSISPEDLLPTVKICVDGLRSPSVAVKRSAAAKLRLLAKNRSDNRALIGESGAVPALIPLLRSSDACAQEHAVTALLNLSLHEDNKTVITRSGAIKSLVYVLKIGTETSKQNAACALLSLSLVEDNKSSIGASGAIPPLVSLLFNGSDRGKKDALTTLYKLCSVQQNKERAVRAGAVKPLVELVSEEEKGLAEKAMVVLSSLACIWEGKAAIVEEGGIPALVEAIEDGSAMVKEFAVLTLLQLCAVSVKTRGLLVTEGGIPPLVALSQTGSGRAKNKVETLLAYLREPRQQTPSSSSSQ